MYNLKAITIFIVGLVVIWGVTMLLDNNPILLILYALFVGYMAGNNSSKIDAIFREMVETDDRMEAINNSITDLEYEIKEDIEVKLNELKKEIEDYIGLNYPDRRNLGTNISELRKEIGLPDKRFFD